MGNYKNARMALLAVVIFSLVNTLMIFFADIYFLFSSYFTQYVNYLGYEIYLESGEISVIIVTFLIAAITVVPYLLCYIFSKKKVGWLIAGLVLFAIDTLILLGDFIALISMGDLSGIMDVVIHVYLLISIIVGVAGYYKNKDAMQEQQTINNDSVASETVDGKSEQDDGESENSVRTISVTRKKSFYGCAIAFDCYIDGKVVGKLTNGNTIQFEVSGANHVFTVDAKGGAINAGTVNIESSTQDVNYFVSLKTGAFSSSIIVEKQ
ncbi:MAG: hypothetical protein IJW13_03465 [Clostridia bacterium]|nr:hypothetical protein [Clostridia bacterium]